VRTTEIIGKKLTDLRLRHGYTQAELSERIRVAQTTYAGYERGRSEPSINTLITLADIYGTSLDFLAGRYDRIPSDELPVSYINELIYLNSEERITEEHIKNVELKQERNFNKFIKNEIENESKRGKYNRVKNNKPKQ
jgi:transcriptional regulator with XRE-family HTH domain